MDIEQAFNSAASPWAKCITLSECDLDSPMGPRRGLYVKFDTQNGKRHGISSCLITASAGNPLSDDSKAALVKELADAAVAWAEARRDG